MYFYKDANNLFHIGNDILPSGKYRLRTFDTENTVSLETTADNTLIMDPIEVIKLLKENDAPYADLDELLTANADFF